MAEQAISQRNFEGAIRSYKEALQFHPDDDMALISLAKLYLMNDDLDQCQYTCTTLLRLASVATDSSLVDSVTDPG